MRYENIINLIEKPMSGEWGKEPHEGDQEVIKVIRTTNFTNIGRLDLQDVVLRKIGHEKVEKKRLLYGDIIIEKSGGSPNQPVGRVVYFDIKNDVYLCNNFTSILRPKKSIVSKYLFYALFYKHITKRTLKYQNKTTGIINLQLQRYLEIEKIPLPPIETQKKIADVLDKAQELIDKRKEQIEKLDEFIQSVFLDMFGDPIKNEKEWDIKELNEVSTIIMGQSPPGDSYNENGKGVPFFQGKAEFTDKFPIVKKWTTKPIKLAESNDTLMSVRAPVGEVNVSNINCCIGRGLAAIRPVNELIQNEFLYNYFKLNKKVISKLGTGSTFKAITSKQLRELKIIVPPIELQNKFAGIVEKAEKQRELLQKSLTEMENNFNSLMQKAFKGELF